MCTSARHAAVGGCALAVLAAGCGAGGASHTTPRPPTPIIVSASIGDEAISASPLRFGAGPITLVITNQSSVSQKVTLETASTQNGPGEKALQTGPISPRGTAQIQASVGPGTYALHVEGHSVKAARLVVGRPRESAQNELLQP